MSRQPKGRKRKARIMLKTGARILKKGVNALRYPKAPTKVPSNGAVFKVKLQKR